jgi:GT2 family glycosyltransferase
MTRQTPTVLVVVLNYRTPELALKSAGCAVTAMQGIAGSITIVDNASGDGSDKIIAKGITDAGWDRVTFLQSPHNGGFGAGNNLAMRAGLPDGTAPDFVYLLNSDAWPRPDAIRVLLDTLAAHPEAGMAGSRIVGDDGVLHHTCFRFPSILGEFEGAVRTGIFTRLLRNWVVPFPVPEATAPVDWVAGASIMMRQPMLDAVGLFDESFFLYFEETDLCLRAARAKWTCLYVPASEAEHLGSVSTGMKEWARTPGYWFDSRMHYFVQNHGRAYALAATVSRALGEGLWRLRCLLTGRARDTAPYFLRDLIAHGLRRGQAGRSNRAIPFNNAALLRNHDVPTGGNL